MLVVSPLIGSDTAWNTALDAPDAKSNGPAIGPNKSSLIRQSVKLPIPSLVA